MGWAYCGTDSEGREIGYGIEATCDHPGCMAKIDRGLAYACGPTHGSGSYYCDRYFCEEHLVSVDPVDDHPCTVCAECAKLPENCPAIEFISAEPPFAENRAAGHWHWGYMLPRTKLDDGQVVGPLEIWIRRPRIEDDEDGAAVGDDGVFMADGSPLPEGKGDEETWQEILYDGWQSEVRDDIWERFRD